MKQIIDVVIPPLAQPFSYLLPEKLKQVSIGYRVLVPLGKRAVTAFVVSKRNQSSDDLSKFAIESVERSELQWEQGLLIPELEALEENRDSKLKAVRSLIEEHPCFDPRQLSFFERVAQYYSVPLSNVLDVAVPQSTPRKFRRQVTFLKQPEKDLRGLKQRQILKFLQEASSAVTLEELQSRFKGCATTLKKFEESNLISITSDEIIDQHIEVTPAAAWAKQSVALSDTQKRALSKITSAAQSAVFSTTLVHGVTGSGKTEVYIEAIKQILALGKGALVIVPEIALTPQLIDRFRARLGNHIAVLHSALSKQVRWSSWRALIEKRNVVAIGARSAIFAPIHNLGIIVVDEEHDSSYKQSEGLRYNARDLSILRGQFESCPVVLGSATPSLESFYRARTKQYTYFSLPLRHATAPKLQVEVVDLSKIRARDMTAPHISTQLYNALIQTLERNEQAFILYNRRGFASFLQCEECSAVRECPNCSVTLTYHQQRNMLICHYCGISMVPPQFCSTCVPQGEDAKPAAMVQRGAGTEKIYDELKELFPHVAIDRLDRDVADDIQIYREILDRVRSGKTSILVGTQMIAKGHDLPGVTLVGIADCDVGLHMPDFRAAERSFQLLTQAAGRAGRADKPGKVVLQTRSPTHLALRATLEQDYEYFAKQELKNRHDLRYPPFARLLRIVASSEDQDLPIQTLRSFRAGLEEFTRINSLAITILGPAPATLQRLKGKWRFHLLLKSESATVLVRAMQFLRSIKLKDRNLHLVYDIDPQDMM